MLASVASAAVCSIEGYLVRVEVSRAPGLPSFAVVGFAEGAVREGRERVTAALHNTGRSVSRRRITVNLASVDVRKEGSAFDLQIAIGVLTVAEDVDPIRYDGWAFVGELCLDGRVRPMRGAPAIAEALPLSWVALTCGAGGERCGGRGGGRTRCRGGPDHGGSARPSGHRAAARASARRHACPAGGNPSAPHCFRR